MFSCFTKIRQSSSSFNSKCYAYLKLPNGMKSSQFLFFHSLYILLVTGGAVNCTITTAVLNKHNKN